MQTTDLTSPPRAPGALGSRDARSAASDLPTLGETLEESIPLIGVVAVVAPPVIFLAGPWLLLGLMLSGPFALVVALLTAAIALVAVVAALIAILAAPFLLVRYVRERRARRVVVDVAVAAAEPAAPLVSLGSPRIAA
jgi:hypothetical protein